MTSDGSARLNVTLHTCCWQSLQPTNWF